MERARQCAERWSPISYATFRQGTQSVLVGVKICLSHSYCSEVGPEPQSKVLYGALPAKNNNPMSSLVSFGHRQTPFPRVFLELLRRLTSYYLLFVSIRSGVAEANSRFETMVLDEALPVPFPNRVQYESGIKVFLLQHMQMTMNKLLAQRETTNTETSGGFSQLQHPSSLSRSSQEGRGGP